MTKILLVDDDQDIRLVGAVALRRVAGWEVVEAASGAEALERIAEERPDVVLLDVMMPKLDGPTTLARIRAHPANADLPVIFLTARAQRHELESYRSLGADGVIPKPFDILTLPDQIRRVVEARGQREADEDERVAALRERYRQRLPELVAELGARLGEEQLPTRERIEAARALAHRLRGTAGTYGFERVSAELGRIEAGLDDLLTGAGGDAPAGWEAIASALRRARDAAALPSSGCDPA